MLARLKEQDGTELLYGAKIQLQVRSRFSRFVSGSSVLVIAAEPRRGRGAHRAVVCHPRDESARARDLRAGEEATGVGASPMCGREAIVPAALDGEIVPSFERAVALPSPRRRAAPLARTPPRPVMRRGDDGGGFRRRERWLPPWSRPIVSDQRSLSSEARRRRGVLGHPAGAIVPRRSNSRVSLNHTLALSSLS